MVFFIYVTFCCPLSNGPQSAVGVYTQNKISCVNKSSLCVCADLFVFGTLKRVWQRRQSKSKMIKVYRKHLNSQIPSDSTRKRTVRMRQSCFLDQDACPYICVFECVFLCIHMYIHMYVYMYVFWVKVFAPWLLRLQVTQTPLKLPVKQILYAFVIITWIKKPMGGGYGQ